MPRTAGEYHAGNFALVSSTCTSLKRGGGRRVGRRRQRPTGCQHRARRRREASADLGRRHASDLPSPRKRVHVKLSAVSVKPVDATEGVELRTVHATTDQRGGVANGAGQCPPRTGGPVVRVHGSSAGRSAGVAARADRSCPQTGRGGGRRASGCDVRGWRELCPAAARRSTLVQRTHTPSHYSLPNRCTACLCRCSRHGQSMRAG